MLSWQVGDVRIDRIVEFQQPLLPALALYPAATPAAIDRHRAWLEPSLMEPGTGLMTIAFHSFLIHAGGAKIIVDTCSGNDRQRPKKTRYHLRHWPYLDNLRAAGVSPEDIDYVLCTHLHVDHVGWNTQLVQGRWVPTFAKAKYLFVRDEWDYWREHYTREAFVDDPYHLDSLLPVIEAGRAQFVEMDHRFSDEVWLDPLPGHTPGHVGVHVRSRGEECVMSGDLMHTALQAAEPDWSSCFCVDPDASAAARRAFLERYADTDVRILPAHFPTPTSGRIVRADGGFRFRFDPDPA
jgi:glyoxylase-like metal-dependent hydrolase (beta-lactamase superfamily II)